MQLEGVLAVWPVDEVSRLRCVVETLEQALALTQTEFDLVVVLQVLLQLLAMPLAAVDTEVRRR